MKQPDEQRAYVGNPLLLSRRSFLKSSLGVATASLLMSCDLFRNDSDVDPRLTARPGSPVTLPSAGLNQLGLGNDRDGILYVPQSYSPEVPAPLFVALHGAGSSGGDWASYFARAEARGMIFLAPDSRSSTWNLVRPGSKADIEFLNRALQHTFDRCRIDPGRLALGGFSDGASNALSLGVSNGDLFSHLIGYSPGFFTPAGSFVGKPRVFVSHGTEDPVLHVSLSRNVIVPRLQSDGFEVTYQEFEGGHEVPPVISQTALNWFFAGN